MSSHLTGDRTAPSAASPAAGAATTPRIDASLSINDVLLAHPATIAVFNAFGVDACCGGAQTVRDAASQDGIDLAQLLAALEGAAGGGQ